MNAPHGVPASKIGKNGNRIRILEVLGNAIVGGMENYVRNLIAHLPGEEFEVIVLCPFESAYTRTLRDGGWPVYVAPLRDDPPWRSIERVCSLIRQHGIHIIHAHLMNAHTVAAMAGRIMDVPTVATVHGMSLHPQEISVTRLTGTHLILVCGEAWSQAVAVGLPIEKLTLISNGVDLATYNPHSASDSVFRDSIGVGPTELLIGYVGRLAWEKGPDKFVKAAQRILGQRPKVHFVLAGTGLMEKDLKLAIEQAGIGGNVHMAGVCNEPQRIYRSLDLMLHTSRADAMPLVLLEAMACGVPVIAIGVGGIPEIIEAGETGILIGTNEWPGVASEYPGDWEGVAQAAVYLLDRPAHLKRMAHASALRAKTLFDIRGSAAMTAEVFQRLASQSAVKHGANGVGVLAGVA